jgi:hypothetical protein
MDGLRWFGRGLGRDFTGLPGGDGPSFGRLDAKGPMRSFLSLGGTALEDLAAAKLALAAAWELKSRRRHKGKALATRHP